MLPTQSQRSTVPDSVPHQQAPSPPSHPPYTPQNFNLKNTDMPAWAQTWHLHPETVFSLFINTNWTNSRKINISLLHFFFPNGRMSCPWRTHEPLRKSDSKSIIWTQYEKSYNRGISKDSGNEVGRIAGFFFFNPLIYSDSYNKKKKSSFQISQPWFDIFHQTIKKEIGIHVELPLEEKRKY